MIVAAGLLVLLGLGLFVAGILTGVTLLYWACVAACVVAAVLLFVVRRQLGANPPASRPEPAAPEPAAPEPAPPAEVFPPAETTTAGARHDAAESGSAPAALGPPAGAAPPEDLSEPGIEEVEVTDLLLVVDLKDEVLVVDEHPRFHVAGCRWLGERETIALPIDEARTDGFTPCAVCSPDRTLAERARAAKQSGQ